MPEHNQETGNEFIAIPLWFVKVTSFIMSILSAGGLAWAGWMSFSIIEIRTMMVRSTENLIRIVDLEKKVYDHEGTLRLHDSSLKGIKLELTRIKEKNNQ